MEHQLPLNHFNHGNFHRLLRRGVAENGALFLHHSQAGGLNKFTVADETSAPFFINIRYIHSMIKNMHGKIKYRIPEIPNLLHG